MFIRQESDEESQPATSGKGHLNGISKTIEEEEDTTLGEKTEWLRTLNNCKTITFEL